MIGVVLPKGPFSPILAPQELVAVRLYVAQEHVASYVNMSLAFKFH
jgi:hypothetical protein